MGSSPRIRGQPLSPPAVNVKDFHVHICKPPDFAFVLLQIQASAQVLNVSCQWLPARTREVERWQQANTLLKTSGKHRNEAKPLKGFPLRKERTDVPLRVGVFFFEPPLTLPEVHHVKQMARQEDGVFTVLFTKVFTVCFILQTPPLELFPPFPPK